MEVSSFTPAPPLSVAPPAMAEPLGGVMAERLLQQLDEAETDEENSGGSWVNYGRDDDEDHRPRHTNRRYRRPVIDKNPNRRH